MPKKKSQPPTPGMMTKEQRAASFAVDRKLKTAVRLLKEAQEVLEKAREDVITAGYESWMKDNVTEAILATINAVGLAATA